MFANTVQPSIVSLFSSTSSDPLSLFSKQQDTSLTEDSFIHFLNDASSLPPPTPPAVLCSVPAVDSAHDESNFGYGLHQTVLHIQSPTLRTTFIQCPPDAGRAGSDLGLKHKWLHLQVRNMTREWSFEIGIVDKSAKHGVIRCSTFQKEPNVTRSSAPNIQPVLHLPLSFPQPSSRPLTAWSTIALNLPSLVPHFSSLAIRDEDDEDDNASRHYIDRPGTFLPVPSGAYSHLSYIKVYATCRLRRIWLSDFHPDSQIPWEFELYGA